MTIRLAAMGLGVVAAIALLIAAGGRSTGEDEAESTAADAERSHGGLPKYDSENQLLLPEDYREWVFVGDSLGLTYSAEPQQEEKFSHVYVNPFGYRAFRQTGQFPVGTIFLLEVAEKGTQENPALGGAYAKRFTGLEAAVKSGDRFDQPWTYYSFDGPDGKRMPKARRITNESCIACHREHAQTDYVFTQFYPVLTDEE